MHAYRQYVQAQMDERGWDRPELARRSGLSRQQVHRILTDDRDRLPERPEPATISALARAFGGDSERVLWINIATAMGLPVEAQRIADPALLSDDDLIRELQRRLLRGRAQADDRAASQPAAASRRGSARHHLEAAMEPRPTIPPPGTSEEPMP